MRGIHAVRMLVVAAGTAATLATVAGPAGAAAGGPAGLCAAGHMTIALTQSDPIWGQYGYPGAVSDGMGHAMSVNNANGNTGMFGAVLGSTQLAQSRYCPPPG